MLIMERIGLMSLILLNSSCGSRTDQISQLASDAVGRRIFAQPADYESQHLSPAEALSLPESMQKMRAMAWKIFKQTIEPTSFTAPLANGQTLQGSMPRFMTWYTIEDIQRLYRRALLRTEAEDLDSPLPIDTIQEAEFYLGRELEDLSPPLQQRLTDWLADHPEPTMEDWMGLGGVSRVYYSPAVLRSIAAQHQKLVQCFQGNERPGPLEAKNTCWTDPLPENSAIVKAAFWNAQSPLPIYPTDAAHLAVLMASPDKSWQDDITGVDTHPSILSARLGRQQLLLPALHIMTKDQKDWLWISAFWSDQPRQDFGADRPWAVESMGPPFNQYKICVVTSFRDEAKDLDELAVSQPDLVAAYRAAQQGNPAMSWCSNPYLEAGPNNQKTNCIGCHQFAGTSAQAESILGHELDFPHHGSQKLREDFPVDYIWSAAKGQGSLLNMLLSTLTWRRSLGSSLLQKEQR